MSAASDFLEGQIGTHLLRTGSWTKPTAIWVALFTTMPDEDGTNGVEVSTSATAYGRVQHGPGDDKWSIPVGGDGVFENIGIIQYAAPTANWGTVVGFGLYSAQTAGDLYVIGNLLQSVAILNNDPAPVFADGALSVTVS